MFLTLICLGTKTTLRNQSWFLMNHLLQYNVTMIRNLSSYENLRQKIIKKLPFTLKEVEQMMKTANSQHHYYLGLSALSVLHTNGIQENSASQFSRILNLVPRSMETTQIYSLLQSTIWKAKPKNMELRRKCKLFNILSDWNFLYQTKLTKFLNNPFVHLHQFMIANTSKIIERILFIQQIYDKIKVLVNFKGFWQNIAEGMLELEISQLHEFPSEEDMMALVQILKISTAKVQIYSQKEGSFYDPLLKNVSGVSQWRNFMYRSIKYLLNNDKWMIKCQNQLTLISLVFLQGADIQMIKDVMNSLVTRTSKAVRFASAAYYQQLLQTLYRTGKMQLVEQVQNIPQVRELVIRRITRSIINEEGFISKQHIQVQINPRDQVIFYFQITKTKSLILLQYIVDSDIGIQLDYLGDLWIQKKENYLLEPKSKSKSIQIMAFNTGIHSLTLNNKYSWLTTKKLKFSIKVYKPYQGQNSQFNLFVYGDEYTPWKGYKGVRFDDQEGEFFHIWKSAVSQQSELIIFQGKCFFGGVVSWLINFKMSRVQKQSIRRCLVVGEESEEIELLKQIKKENNHFKIRYCQYEDI